MACDVRTCYDTIDPLHLMKIIKHKFTQVCIVVILSLTKHGFFFYFDQYDYNIRNYAVVKRFRKSFYQTLWKKTVVKGTSIVYWYCKDPVSVTDIIIIDKHKPLSELFVDPYVSPDPPKNCVLIQLVCVK